MQVTAIANVVFVNFRHKQILILVFIVQLLDKSDFISVIKLKPNIKINFQTEMKLSFKLRKRTFKISIETIF